MENLDQIITLTNRKNLLVGGANKIISLKPDLIQLDTITGGLIIIGEQLELVKLDNSNNTAEINGNINTLKFTQTKSKENIFRKIFK